ncbi:MAG: ferric reductase-like transmembrane domain-containing protein [Pyrinomonadaceae bacterium]
MPRAILKTVVGANNRNMTAQDLSTYLGLLAIGLLTFNILLGLLISVRYQAKKHFPYLRINIFKIHNWTGYIALGVVFSHPVLLLFSKTAGFGIIDIAVPLWSPTQASINTLGAIAFYLLAFVVVTSYYRVRIGRRLWKSFHYAGYAAAVLFFIHGIWTDPYLQNSALDPFDAEKVFVELCFLAVIIGVSLRLRYAWRKEKRAAIF